MARRSTRSPRARVCPLKRARERIAAVVARRSFQPTEEFVAVQVARLNEAMLVAYGALRDGNLAAVDRVMKLTREYDRYHGLKLRLAKGTEWIAGAPSRQTALTDAPMTALGHDTPAARLTTGQGLADGAFVQRLNASTRAQGETILDSLHASDGMQKSSE